MEIVIRATAHEVATTVADIVENYVRKGPATLGLATGSSPSAATGNSRAGTGRTDSTSRAAARSCWTSTWACRNRTASPTIR